MQRRRLFWQIFPAFALLSAGLPLLLYLSGRETLGRSYHDELIQSLKAQAAFFSEAAAAPLSRGDASALNEMAKRLGTETGTRITVILPDGKVLAESHEDPARMENHRLRPEIATAFRDGVPGWQLRLSATLHEPFLYVARPVVRQGKVEAVVRTAQAAATSQQALRTMQQRLLWAAALAAVLTAAIGWYQARRIVRPVETLTAVAHRFGSGDLDCRISPAGSQELATLAEAMNNMASQLQEQMQTIVRQQNEQDIVFQSMAEGLVTVDLEGRILDINEAGEQMFQVKASQIHGRYVHGVLRQPQLLSLLEKLLAGGAAPQVDFMVHDKKLRYLTAWGNILHKAGGQHMGALLMLRDVTKLHELENVGRDFVANASHEIRTPLTSIKGFVETLADGGWDDQPNAQRFLQIIRSETDRLIAMLDDVLSLARIEKESQQQEIVFARGPLRRVIDAAVARLAPAAEQRQVKLAVECPDELQTQIHAGLLEQAVSNLVDNAIKYSAVGGEVCIVAAPEAGGARIDVIDHGCGIEARHLPRLFERFYRVAADRSRETGGTGLGLALVRHIATAHGGWATVESKPGTGSRFSIHLPAAGA